MEYVPEVLKDYIYKKDLSIEQMIDFGKQLVRAVEVMH